MTRRRIAVLVAFVILAVLVPAAPAASAPPTNDVFSGAVEIDPAALPFTDSLDTTEATTDDDDARANATCGAPATDASVWYSITPTSDTHLVVDTEGTDYSTGPIVVVNGTPGSFQLVVCSPGGVVAAVEAGTTYYILVVDAQTDGGGNGGQLELQVDTASHVCGLPFQEIPATIVGSGLIVGTRGDDVIVGSDERDRILGRGGNDIICGEGGNDLVNGGPGDDLILGDNLDLPRFGESDGDNDDYLIGGPGQDTVIGLAGDDNIRGGSGHDELIGNGGRDDIRGGRGNDDLFGGPHDDRMRGDSGDDTLFGSFGSDTIWGGPGNDFLDGDNPNELPPGVEPPFPPGGNDDLCGGGPGTDEVVNCETVR